MLVCLLPVDDPVMFFEIEIKTQGEKANSSWRTQMYEERGISKAAFGCFPNIKLTVPMLSMNHKVILPTYRTEE